MPCRARRSSSSRTDPAASASSIEAAGERLEQERLELEKIELGFAVSALRGAAGRQSAWTALCRRRISRLPRGDPSGARLVQRAASHREGPRREVVPAGREALLRQV